MTNATNIEVNINQYNRGNNDPYKQLVDTTQSANEVEDNKTPSLNSRVTQSKHIKRRNMMYVQQVEFLGLRSIETLLHTLETVIKPNKYALIVHDQDVYLDTDKHKWEQDNETLFPYEVGSKKSAHVHVMMKFDNARSLVNIAKLLQDTPQTVQAWNTKFNNGCSYLLHETSGSKEKHRYDVSEVQANFDFEKLITGVRNGVRNQSDDVATKMCLDKLYSGEMTVEEVEKSLTGSQYSKVQPRIAIICRKLSEEKAKRWKKKMVDSQSEIEVVWIYGPSGKGKTRVAKEYAEQYTSKYYVSGSNKDPFQQYAEEAIVILDELRPDTFIYSDLLKLLDPYNREVLGASRYYDKAVIAEKIIITTPYSPKQFYSALKLDERVDSFLQLSRRIGAVITLEGDYLYTEFFHEKEGNFRKDKSTRQDNPFVQRSIGAPFEHHERTEKISGDIMRSIEKVVKDDPEFTTNALEATTKHEQQRLIVPRLNVKVNRKYPKTKKSTKKVKVATVPPCSRESRTKHPVSEEYAKKYPRYFFIFIVDGLSFIEKLAEKNIAT